MKVFITGGTTGVGLALAQAYLERGDEVGICGRDLTKLPEGFQTKYPKLITYEADVLNREALGEIIKKFGEDGLDLVIANAGRSVGKKTKLPNFEISRHVFEVNVFGVLNTFEPAVELMIKQGSGQLAAVASVAGFVGLPGASSYSASKAAILKLCESYNIDLHKFGIGVSAIAPGFIDTPLTQQNNHNMPWLMTKEKAAKVIMSGLDKRKALIIFPLRMRMVITFLDKIPRLMYRILMKMPAINYSK